MEKFLNQIIEMDWLLVARSLPDNSVDCLVTSPPYWGLRDYGVEGQFGNENTSTYATIADIKFLKEKM